MKRSVQFEYQDPLDCVWLAALAQLGIRLLRSQDVYAAWDGAGTLTLSDRSDFDPDDSLAQLIFHELCHLLVAGDQGYVQADWGLDNTSEKDLIYEHACHRVQAALAQPYGLREFFAVTTDWRPYWDAMPENTLADCDDPALPFARAGFARAEREPFRQVLQQALTHTAAIAAIVRSSNSSLLAQGAAATRPLLWTRTRARHATGFLLNVDATRRCGQCAWAYVDAEATSEAAALRCRQAKPGCGPKLAPGCDVPWPEDGVPVPADSVACEHWEAVLSEDDCADCGACCHRGFDVVDVAPDDEFLTRHPQLVVYQQPSGRAVLPRPDGNCVALSGDGSATQPYRCKHYAERPTSCRDFELGGDACLIARQRAHVAKKL